MDDQHRPVHRHWVVHPSSDERDIRTKTLSKVDTEDGQLHAETHRQRSQPRGTRKNQHGIDHLHERYIGVLEP